MLRTATWIALALVLALAIADAVLAPAPIPEESNFIDTFLASRAVVVAIRVAIIFAAIFVVRQIIDGLRGMAADTHQVVDKERDA